MSRDRGESSSSGYLRTLVVFQVADQQYAVSSGDVAEILPMAELQSAPGAPKLLAGFLNLAGELIPVIRLHHLFGLPEATREIWTPLVILRNTGRRLGVIVDSVSRTLAIDEKMILPLPRQRVANECVIGIVRSNNGSLSVLSPEQLLLQEEHRAVAEMQQMVQQRIDELNGVPA